MKNVFLKAKDKTRLELLLKHVRERFLGGLKRYHKKSA